MEKETQREISWIKAARKEFDRFPLAAREEIAYALAFAADGKMPEIAKPMKGLGSGVFEISLRHQGDAYRTVYAIQIGENYGWWMPLRKNQQLALKPRNMKSI